MGFGYYNTREQTIALSDLTADGTVPIFKVPARNAKIEILEATATLDTTISAGVGTTVVLQLVDMGGAGTTLAGTVASALGAAGTGDWTKNVPRAFTVSDGTLDAGDWLAVHYDETGAVAPLNMIVTFVWVDGVGA